MDKKIIHELLGKPNVISVGRGHKKVKGVDTGKPCIVIGVSKKLPLSELEPKDIIPKTVGNTPEVTDIVELGEIKLL